MRIWTSRLLNAIVTAWNLQAAIVFIISPGLFVHAYELSGAAGEAAIRGVGILFLMLNVPYVFAVINPVRYRLGVMYAVLMQLTGLIGESYIFSTLPAGYEILKSSILRFIIFDGAGLEQAGHVSPAVRVYFVPTCSYVGTLFVVVSR